MSYSKLSDQLCVLSVAVKINSLWSLSQRCDTPHTWCGVVPFAARSREERNLEIFDLAAAAADSVSTSGTSLQLSSHPAVRQMLHKRFRCSKNKNVNLGPSARIKTPPKRRKTHTQGETNGQTDGGNETYQASYN